MSQWGRSGQGRRGRGTSLSRGMGPIHGSFLFVMGCTNQAPPPTTAETGHPAAAADGAPQSKQDTGQAQQPAAAHTNQGVSDSEVKDSASSSGSGAVEPAPSPQAQVAEACEANCQRIDSTCARSARACRASCSDYVQASSQCPVEIYEALQCQHEAEVFLLCSNVSPEKCSPLVRAMQDCRTGKVPPAVWGAPKTKEKEAELGAPNTWVRLAHSRLGFSLLLPHGAEWKTLEGLERASVRDGDLEYQATLVSLAGKKMSDGLILRTVAAEVGKACEAELRLHGRYESQGTTHLRFNSLCKGDQDYFGVVQLRGSDAVLVSIHRQGKFEEPPEYLEPLVFGYEAPQGD